VIQITRQSVRLEALVIGIAPPGLEEQSDLSRVLAECIPTRESPT
jgi:hypothetical protein